jgi:hypothetical protein
MSNSRADLEDQRRILESLSVSARDRTTVHKLLTRMENHYFAQIRERNAQIARLTDSEAAASLKLRVLERVAAAAEMKFAAELEALEHGASASAHEARTLQRELELVGGRVHTFEADIRAAVLAIGTELARVESSEVEVRQVLGFLRQSNRIKGKQYALCRARERRPFRPHPSGPPG